MDISWCPLSKAGYFKTATLVFHIKFWYSVKHAVIFMKIGFVPEEFDFYQTNLTKAFLFFNVNQISVSRYMF